MLANKVIIVTGASEGIGRALCLQLASQQVKLVLASRNMIRLATLKSEIQKAGSEALMIPTDITQQEDCQNLIEETIRHYGKIDILINNAGMSMRVPFSDIKELSVIEKIHAVNYFGSVYCTYFALPHLKESKGQIVTISSMTGLLGMPLRTAYSAAKHALFGFFDSLRIELQDSGVSVTMIAPDFVASEIHTRALDGEGQAMNTSHISNKKIMTADSCAGLIIKAITQNKRFLITTLRGKFAFYLKPFLPRLIEKMASASILKGK